MCVCVCVFNYMYGIIKWRNTTKHRMIRTNERANEKEVRALKLSTLYCPHYVCPHVCHAQ